MDEFLFRMKNLLGGEFEVFLSHYESESYFRGLRVNTLKCTAEELFENLGFPPKPTPFCPDGYYIPEDVSSLGNSPLHHCGAFYIQEPSASSAVEMLGVKRGERVLDLCAAPGGKSTQIGAKLGGEGLLWSNEIVKSRANILLSNIERMGIPNAVVSCAHPDELCERLSSRFDRVLVDAPCSGEGMFKKNEAREHWSVEHVKSCAERQLNILNSAKKALKPGGALVYSTCTFSREENEELIARFLSENSDFEPEEPGVSFGRESQFCSRRIFPQDGGEGHFAVRLRKKGSLTRDVAENSGSKANSELLDFYDSLFINRPFGERLELIKDKIYILPKNYNFDIKGINILRAGILLGEIVKRRIEPHHSAFMAARPEQCRASVELGCDSKEIKDFLHGEEIAVDPSLKGYCAVCVEGMTTGFGKASNGRLKNKYPKGLRTVK